MLKKRKKIKQVKKDIPAKLYDREAYINGLVRSSSNLIRKYEREVNYFNRIKNALVDKNGVVRFVKSPQDLDKLMKSQTLKENTFMWSQAKGVPNVQDYEKQVKQIIDELITGNDTVEE